LEWNDNANRSRLIFAGLIFAISVIIITYQFGIWEDEGEESSDHSSHDGIAGITYYVEVKYNGTEDYRIRIPIAVNRNGTVLHIVENLEVMSGNGSFFISNSSEGRCLEIHGNASVTLMGLDQIALNISDIPTLTLGENLTSSSLDYPSEMNFTMYADNITESNYISVYIQLNTHHGHRRYDQSIRAVLTSPEGEKQFKGYLNIAMSAH